MHATRTLDKRSPRMVKRRNSPYKSFDRGLPRRVNIDCCPSVKKRGGSGDGIVGG